jgi:hypothetical protein
MNFLLLLLLGSASLALPAWADGAKPVGASEQGALQDYGKTLLKQQSGIDLDNLGRIQLWDAGASSPGAPGQASLLGPGQPQRNMGLDMNFSAVPGGLQDLDAGLPLAVNLNSHLQLLPNQWDLVTRVHVPLRGRGLLVSSSLKLPQWAIPSQYELFTWTGLDHPWLAEWSYEDNWDREIFGTGFSTKISGGWDLHYRWETDPRNGEGSQKLGLGHNF